MRRLFMPRRFWAGRRACATRAAAGLRSREAKGRRSAGATWIQSRGSFASLLCLLPSYVPSGAGVMWFHHLRGARGDDPLDGEDRRDHRSTRGLANTVAIGTGGMGMPDHDFSGLFDRYPSVIKEMQDMFDRHQFILELARSYQGLYIEALSSYSHKPAPFRIVHGFLSKHLSTCAGLVERAGDVVSADIFGNHNQCARWRKL